MLREWIKALTGHREIPTKNEAPLPAPTPEPASETPLLEWPLEEMKRFHCHIAGVSHNNDDGSSRQRLLTRCIVGEHLVLIPEPTNPADPHALKVCRLSGEQLGYMPAGSIDPADVFEGLVRVSLMSVGRAEGTPFLGATLTVTRLHRRSFLVSLTDLHLPSAAKVKVRDRLTFMIEGDEFAVRRKSGGRIGTLAADAETLELFRVHSIYGYAETVAIEGSMPAITVSVISSGLR